MRCNQRFAKPFVCRPGPVSVKWGMFLILLAAILVSCQARLPAPHPGSVDQFDSSTYDALLVYQGALREVKSQYYAGELPKAAKPSINQAGRIYNSMREAWLAYRQAKTFDEKAVTQKQITDLRAQLDKLILSLKQFKKGG